MHNGNNTADRTGEAAFWNEPAIMESGSFMETSTQTADRLRVNLEMAVEWAHLGGD
jgi:hypothetical protein